VKTIALSAAAILLSAGLAHAGSVVAAADTYVQRDNSGPHGSEMQIFVKNAGSGWATRKGLIRFVVPSGAASSASLSLDVSLENNTTGGSSTATIYVWGIKDASAASCGESFSESSVLYGDLSFLDDSADGVVDGSACLHDGDASQAGVQMLGSFTISGADVGTTVIFSNAALADFMSRSTDGVVTLALTRAENNGQLNTGFASREHATLNGPRLAWVPAETYTAVADTYVMGNNSGGHGSEGGIVVTNYDSASYDRKGMIRFSVPAGSFADAGVSLDLASYYVNGTGHDTATFYLYGLKDGTTGCQESFSEATLVYNNTPFLDDSPDGVINSSSCLHSPAALAQITVSSADVGKTVTFHSPELARFLDANTNGNVTFALTTTTVGPYMAFASRENTAHHPPTLSVTRADAMVFDDGGPVSEGGGVYSYVGKLHLPIAGGKLVALPEADVEMTYDANGRLATLSGTVGYPQLPGEGLWGNLGNIQGAAPHLQIGYDYGSAFDDYGLPLDQSAKYFYLVASTETSLSWGPMSMSAPGAASLLLAIDPATPAFFTHMDEDGTFLPIAASIDFGFSDGQNIPFKPSTTWGVTSQMTSFGGDVYLGGSIAPPLEVENVDLTLSGDVTVAVNRDNFSVNDPGKWIQNLGANAGVSVGVSVGAFSFDWDVANASVLYDRATPSFAFSAAIDPSTDALHGLPFVPKGTNAKMAGYVSNSVSQSFVDFEGEFKFGPSFAKQKIEGHAHVGGSGGSFDGTAKFASTTVTIAGAVYASYATFSGSIDHTWDIGIGHLKTTITTSFDSRNAEVDLSATAKGCIDGNCDSVGIHELSVDSNGHIRICVDVPGSGTKCDTLS